MNEEALLITESMLLYYTERKANSRNHPHIDKLVGTVLEQVKKRILEY
jgi:hypothetical protein